MGSPRMATPDDVGPHAPHAPVQERVTDEVRDDRDRREEPPHAGRVAGERVARRDRARTRRPARRRRTRPRGSPAAERARARASEREVQRPEEGSREREEVSQHGRGVLGRRSGARVAPRDQGGPGTGERDPRPRGASGALTQESGGQERGEDRRRRDENHRGRDAGHREGRDPAREVQSRSAPAARAVAAARGSRSHVRLRERRETARGSPRRSPSGRRTRSAGARRRSG
jgi:hypothetical protein